MDYKTLEIIVSKQKKIQELETIQEEVEKHNKKTIVLNFKTRYCDGFVGPILLNKHKIKISKNIMLEILQQMIKNEKEYIDKIIECEIENRISNRDIENFKKRLREENK